ncbi:MAG: hypothetical protein ING89_12500 [Rubrivivax sp.]|nr:hypothetical protein [Rubrivivax sp.]
MRKHCARAGLLAAVIALAGCGGGGSAEAPTSGSSPGTTPVTPYTLQPTGAPLAVTVALDSARAVVQDVPLTGGTLTATGADGSVYTLRIPANALVAATRITLTPVAQVSNLPLGETARTGLGVQMEPSGLQFVNPATLTITPAAASAVPLARQLFVQWEGSGQKLALAAPNPRSADIELSVMHFSGMGVVRSKGLDADIEPVRQRIGGDAERRIQSATAEALHRERQAQLLGTDAGAAGLQAQLTRLFNEFRQQVVLPRIAAAPSSCAAARLALTTVIGVERQRQLLGLDSDSSFDSETAGLMAVAAEVCMKEEFEICRDEHVLSRIIPARLGLERQAQLLGLDEGAFSSTDRYVIGCLKFELDFFSTAGVRSADFDTDEGVQALRVRLQWDPARLAITAASVPLQSTVFDVRSKRSCIAAVNATRIGSSFDVDEFGFTLNGEDVQDFQLEFGAGLTGSFFQARDTCSSPPQTSPLQLLLNHGTAYGPARVATATTPTEAWTVTGWTVQRATVLATKSERVTYQFDARTSLYYDDRWELRHAPGL